MNNRDKFAETYATAFAETYPEFEASMRSDLIAKATKMALECIRRVDIQRPAFKLTCKRLGIKCTFKAIEEFLAEEREPRTAAGSLD